MLYFYFIPINEFSKVMQCNLGFSNGCCTSGLRCCTQQTWVVPPAITLCLFWFTGTITSQNEALSWIFRTNRFNLSHLCSVSKKFNLNDIWEHRKLSLLNFSHVVLLVKGGLTVVIIRFTIFWNMMHHVIFLFHTLKRVFKCHTAQSWIFKLMLHLRTSMLHPTDVGCSANHNFVFILSNWNHNQSMDKHFAQNCHIWKI